MPAPCGKGAEHRSVLVPASVPAVREAHLGQRRVVTSVASRGRSRTEMY